MTSFLSRTIKELQKREVSFSDLTFVLPSKRAGAFLRQEISKTIDQPVFSPSVVSIEEFTEKVSQLQTIDSTTTLFELYSVYKQSTPKEQTEDFEKFSNWGQTLIHDFNEIDRYLVPPNSIFNYLSEIQDINHWSLHQDKTDLVKNYLAFWKKLPDYYQALKKNLLDKQQGYQGLVYRFASEKIEDFAKEKADNYVFVGFNALNSAEQLIIQNMLAHGAQIFWDIDEVHFKDNEHDVSLFIREYVKNWPYYRENPFQKLSRDYSSEKNIEIIGIPKNIGQAKYAGEILSNLDQQELESTALVLGDENLLLPMLNSIPNNIGSLNITMGLPLKNSPFSALFEKLFEIQKVQNNRFYYKDVISVLNNSVVKLATKKKSEEAVETIKSNNLLYLSGKQLLELFGGTSKVIAACFPENEISPKDVIENFKILIAEFQLVSKGDPDPINLQFLYQHHLVIEQLEELVENYEHLNSVSSLHHFYKEISSSNTLDFQGKPFRGLQLMGVLESRVLDFDTVILTSVDEGTLPAGKSTNSFIPYDLKRSFNLPTYKEKDAIYAYHFYHLLHRAKKVYLLHNTDNESQMGGEKSRFLIQLEIEKKPLHKINNSIVVPEVPPIENQLQTVEKSPEIMEKIKDLARDGFSPSALTTYVRNPLDFYRQYVLGIRDKEEVEETIAYNTLGTVVHDTLEAFYMDLKDQQLTIGHLEKFKAETPAEVIRQFEKTYSTTPLTSGKNLLIFEVVKRYVTNFLNMEISDIKSGKIIIVKEIETYLNATLKIEQLDFPVKLRGKVDRVDVADGVMRIIDYKTGRVSQNQLEILEWEEITSDYDKFAKPFQVLAYATMLLEKDPLPPDVEAGIISFKNLKEGFLKFAVKGKARGAKKDPKITNETLENFNTQLKNLILEICDPEIAFKEKEIKPVYGTY